MSKIILVAQEAVGTPTMSGIGYYTKCLIRALLAHGQFDYEILLFDYNSERGNLARAEQYFGEFDVPIHVCTDFDYRRLKTPKLGSPESSFESVTGIDGDIIHYFSIFFMPLSTSIRQIFTIHDLGMLVFPEYWTDVDKKLGKHCIKQIVKSNAAVVADSESTKREISQFTDICKDKVSVVYQSFDTSEVYRDTSEIKGIDAVGNSRYFLFVGLVINKKNVLRMVEAFEKVCLTENANLVISGYMFDMPETNNILARIKNSCVAERIILTGYISDEQKRQLYSKAVCLLYPSLHEGFGIPVLEAQACGCPVIASNVKSLPEVAESSAILVDPYDADALAFEMKRVLISDTLRNELIEKGYNNIKRFTWENAAKQMEDVYRKVVNER